jgi:hypothetical protein
VLTGLLWSLDLNCERTSWVLHAWCRELCEHTTPESACKCRNSVNFLSKLLSSDVKLDQNAGVFLPAPRRTGAGRCWYALRGADNPAKRDVGNREFSFFCQPSRIQKRELTHEAAMLSPRNRSVSCISQNHQQRFRSIHFHGSRSNIYVPS